MLEKRYNSQAIELQVAAAWEKAGVFRAGAGASLRAKTFSVVMPPPNVTGSLHMGHALNSTIQDILIRFERMRGKNVLWQPGMDHAGIATQMVVERQFADRKEPSRQEIGRKEFVKHVWKWRRESGNMIANQLRRLGLSCDWSRERFTMDEGLSEAVQEVFITLYKKKLIYKDRRLVNWDPRLLTAISDLEVEQKEVRGSLWYFRYPLDGIVFDPNNTSTFIVVATTRPETILGDTAIAVNPDDERYRGLVGKQVILPLVGRKLVVVGDHYADLKTGSGAVKITPAHDFNDFEVARRHNLRIISILDQKATVSLKDNANFLAGLEQSAKLNELITLLDGLDRFSARRQILAMMENGRYLDKIEEHVYMLPHGDRSDTPIEPLLTNQWYMNVTELAPPAIAAIQERRTIIVPQSLEKTYLNWMKNVKPWCISRQLWWGHQIPAWYGPDGAVFVEKSEEEAKIAARVHYGSEVGLVRDEDVLDTWFSSAIWPFSVLGWPNKTEDLAVYYPITILVTGFDLVFFWVARMMMMGLYFMGEVPFRTVYMHALVCDKHGAKMSKSKGNVVDPLELIEKYSADALRFTIAIMLAQGRDIKLDPKRIAGYRNFGTKLWNATRFGKMNGMFHDPDFFPEKTKLAVNRWILTELTQAAAGITENISICHFNNAAEILYHFIWNSFCDWYLELIKPLFQSNDQGLLKEVRGCIAWCLDEIYKLLHPFMPFMTEELWAKTAEDGVDRPSMLAVTAWPDLHFCDKDAAADINWLIDLISGIRSLRADVKIPVTVLVPLVVLDADQVTCNRLYYHKAVIRHLARIEDIVFSHDAPAMSAQMVLGNITFCMPFGSLFEFDIEKARLEQELNKVSKNIERIMKKLANERFLVNARLDVVEAKREQLSQSLTSKNKIEKALTYLLKIGRI